MTTQWTPGDKGLLQFDVLSVSEDELIEVRFRDETYFFWPHDLDAAQPLPPLQGSGEEASGTPDVEVWITREFGGWGLALRREEDPPIPGEPLMSMDVAKDICRRAIAKTLADTKAAAPKVGDVVAEALLSALNLVWDSVCTSPTSTPSKAALLATRAAIIKAGGRP